MNSVLSLASARANTPSWPWTPTSASSRSRHGLCSSALGISISDIHLMLLFRHDRDFHGGKALHIDINQIGALRLHREVQGCFKSLEGLHSLTGNAHTFGHLCKRHLAQIGFINATKPSLLKPSQDAITRIVEYQNDERNLILGGRGKFCGMEHKTAI